MAELRTVSQKNPKKPCNVTFHESHVLIILIILARLEQNECTGKVVTHILPAAKGLQHTCLS